MNILFVVPWDQDTGGVASVVGNLGRYLQGRRHRIVYLFPTQSRFVHYKKSKWGFDGVYMKLRVPFVEGKPIQSLLGFLLFLPLTIFRLTRLIQRLKINVVNIHYPGDAFLYFVLFRYLCRVKIIVSVHGADLFPGGKPRPRYSWALRVLLHTSNAVIAPSQAFLRDVVAILPGLGGKARYIYNGISLAEFSKYQECGRDGLRQKYILCIAAHNEKKGVDVLIRAFALLRNEGAALALKLVGDGELTGELQALAGCLQIGDQVEFLGERNRSDVIKLLKDCEVFVLPSRSEPFGIVVVEAMACKKPVVASAVGGIPEIIRDGIDGLLVEPDNPTGLAQALTSLLENSEFRQVIAESGYNTARNRFSSEMMGSAYEQMVASL